MKLLIADDSSQFLRRLEQRLSAIEGLEDVTSASDGIEAIDLVHKLRPDAVILDIRMPGASGIVVLREIKHHYPETKVIMLTGNSERQYRETCRQFGADHFLSKGDGPARLVEILEDLVRSRKAASRGAPADIGVSRDSVLSSLGGD